MADHAPTKAASLPSKKKPPGLAASSRPSLDGIRPKFSLSKECMESGPPSPDVMTKPGIALQESSWCYPTEGAAVAQTMGVNTAHPYWRQPNASVIAPQHAFRKPGPWGLDPLNLQSHELDEIDECLETEFIGATLCGSITITKFLLAGGYGRGWAGEFIDPKTGKKSVVFVKTLGVMQSDADTPKRREDERKARIEATVYTHRWFAAAVDQPGTAIQRLCFGSCVNKASGFNGDIFFVCGELCAAGDMWAYQVHKESFTEPFGRRILGQLARGLRVMKHSGEIGREMSDFDRGLAHITAGESLVVKGCFHRDIKLENIIVSEDFSCKIMDYGSLKFTDEAGQQVGMNGKITFNAKTPWQGTDVFKPPSFFYDSPRVVVRDGYDPAAWDVWSFGTILMYACAGRSLYKKLGKDVYRFFELTLKVRPSEPHQIQAWYRKRAKVNNECLFYETTEAGTPVKKDGRGIPQVPRIQCKDSACASATNPTGAAGNHCPEEGIPTNHRLWEYLSDIDPDRAGGPGSRAISRQLKDLLNRILDVDPEIRIPIDDVCQHPWFGSHQASGSIGLPVEALETPAERELYMAEMGRRYTQYVDTNSGSVYISAALPMSSLLEAADEYAKLETGLLVQEVDTRMTAKKQPTLELFRAKPEDAGSPLIRTAEAAGFPLYRVTLEGNGRRILLHWVRNRAVVGPTGALVNSGATLAEWHHFVETMKESIAARKPPTPTPPPPAAAANPRSHRKSFFRKPRPSAETQPPASTKPHKSSPLDDCTVS